VGSSSQGKDPGITCPRYGIKCLLEDFVASFSEGVLFLPVCYSARPVGLS
jgi:hypothetical protein